MGTRNKKSEPNKSVDESLPESLLSIPTDIDLLYDELGGPAQMPNNTLGKHDFARYCNEFELDDVAPILGEWNDNPDEIRRHWPWVAFAAAQYRFERRESQRHDDEPTPTEIRRLVQQIGSRAEKLADDFCLLASLAARINDPTAPYRRGHIAWIYEFILQSISFPSPDLDKRPEANLRAWSDGMGLLTILTHVGAAAEVVESKIDSDLLRRSKPQREGVGLYNLTWRASALWVSLTGRTPSANKVHKAGKGEQSPDFVRFVGQISRLADEPEPTRNQVSTALLANQTSQKSVT